MICADTDKIVRVFSNILRNAAAYSYADTEIVISAEEKDGQTVISFQNEGNHIPEANFRKGDCHFARRIRQRCQRRRHGYDYGEDTFFLGFS